jgi:DNA (cytosine-5)-methyltransferase 1
MRMLTAGEYMRAQGFRDDYRVPCVHKLAVRLIGNAVSPPVARAVCEAVIAHHERN